MTVSATTAANLVISAGEILIGFDVATKVGTSVGATEDDSKFVVKRKVYEGKFNGVLGPVKGVVKIIEEIPEMEFTVSELTMVNIQMAMPAVTETVNATGNSYSTESQEIPAEAYVNVAIKVPKGNTGKFMYFVIENALSKDLPDFQFNDDKNVKLKCKLQGYYDPANPTKAPWRIIDETVTT